MTTIDIIEAQRLKIQSQLDLAKTQSERNKQGQFATPTALATEILAYAKSLLPPDLKLRFLDPAIGTGSFISALLRSFPLDQVAEIMGYEIDAKFAEKTLELWRDKPLTLHIADFTQAEPPKTDEAKANLLVCNPPYVRHHFLSKQEKQRLQRTVLQKMGIKLSGQAGLYCHFLCISHLWMVENCLAGWLIPSEFMDVNYGRQIKRYLLNNVTLVRVHRFDPKDLQFSDALVSSAVIWFRKARPPVDHDVEFTFGGTLTAPAISKSVSINILRNTAKWTRFPLAADSTEQTLINSVVPIVETRENPKVTTNTGFSHKSLTLADLFDVKRGLATGANKFFLLTPEQITKYQLPEEFLVPVLPSPRYLPCEEIKADSLGNPLLSKKNFLLMCNLPEEEVKFKYPSLWEYLQVGVEAGVNQGYICSHRTPWYSQEKRPASMFLCTYMGRQDTESTNPFRFILNHSRAVATNVYLILYPKTNLQKMLKDKPELVRLVWQNLNNILPKTLVEEGRIYGDGLHKLEPKELSNVPIDNFIAILPGPHLIKPTLFEKRSKSYKIEKNEG